jgi:hypothetical protein
LNGPTVQRYYLENKAQTLELRKNQLTCSTHLIQAIVPAECHLPISQIGMRCVCHLCLFFIFLKANVRLSVKNIEAEQKISIYHRAMVREEIISSSLSLCDNASRDVDNFLDITLESLAWSTTSTNAD